ncbi:MAG: excinuclease ABC subunit A [Verrucomicrobia bacterium]|nr:excinuclease ABC subunit A [Verrucomicrobiota bacterium]
MGSKNGAKQVEKPCVTAPAECGCVEIRGARQNNLKGIDVDLRLGELTVVIGPSGSGKSSLAFDTIYAEGQRRYVETFSPYMRQFLDRMDKPRVDDIRGIPPAIAIEQANPVKSSRSTVGTMTEINDYLKLLWPRIAKAFCPNCGCAIRQETAQSIAEQVFELFDDGGQQNPGSARDSRAAIGDSPITSADVKAPPDTERAQGSRRVAANSTRVACAPRNVLITFWVAVPPKTKPREYFEFLQQQGYLRVWLNGEVHRVDTGAPVERLGARVQVIQDRLTVTDENRARLIEAIETALRFGKDRVNVIALRSDGSQLSTNNSQLPFSTGWHCAHCDLDIRPPTPGLFSFNNPLGACPECRGFGRTIAIDLNKAIPDRSLTIAQGVVRVFRGQEFGQSQKDLLRACAREEIEIDRPFEELPKADQDFVINGERSVVAARERGETYTDDDYENGRWYGVRGFFRWLESNTYKMHVRVLLSRYRAYTLCPSCNGTRFKADALNYRIAEERLPIAELLREAQCETANAEAVIPSEVEESRDVTVKLAQGDSSTSLRCARNDEGCGAWLTLPQFQALAISYARDLLATVEIAANDSTAEMLRKEICARLTYLCEVGLGYLTLDRSTRTLSGGEVQRVNLTTCLGASLVNTLFVMDEPSVGLHPRDVGRLVRVMHNLRDKGNTLLVVEHEEQMIRAADNLIDIGPGRGESGGELVFSGKLHEFLACNEFVESRATRSELAGRSRRVAANSTPVACAAQNSTSASLTRDYLTGSKSIPLPKSRRKWRDAMCITGAREHNLKNLAVDIPLGVFTCVTGVSGSGKSTLIHDVLYRNLLRAKGQAGDREPGVCEGIAGASGIGEVVMVDQSPLARTPRSTPILYLGLYDRVRELFAALPEAQAQGLTASAFSFNSGSGRCERCCGTGFEKIEMQFLSDLYVRCAECEGRRFQPHVLKIKLHGKSIHDVLEMTVTEAAGWFAQIGEASHPKRSKAERNGAEGSGVGFEVTRRDSSTALHSGRNDEQRGAAEICAGLEVLEEVGLGYLRLGQPLNTLSGGESQRLKLVSHLTGPNQKSEIADQKLDNLFIFDEPTTGLHFDDVAMLLALFQRLVDAGHSLVVIEHNLEVIKCADWIIDLGPEGGDAGGEIVATGTPEQIASCDDSHTGRFLRAVIPRAAERSRSQTSTLTRRAPSAPLRYAQDDEIVSLRVAEEVGSARDSPRTVYDTVADDADDFSLRVAEEPFDGWPNGAHDSRALPGHGRTRAFAEHDARFANNAAIAIHGAREHNLKNLNIEIPRDQMVIITGLSGSGKSTLAFDILFSEGQRRFLDSLSPYARQFAEQLEKPDVDLVEGLPPSVAIEQRVTRGGGKSTVATVTEVYHFLRLLFAKTGTQFCPDCDLPVEKQSVGAIVKQVETAARRGQLKVLAPLVKARKGFHSDVARWAERNGFDTLLVDGQLIAVAQFRKLERFKEHTIDVVVGVIDAKRIKKARNLTQRALEIGRGTAHLLDARNRLTVMSTEMSCPGCGRAFEELDPRLFSFNSPHGACEECGGFGEIWNCDLQTGESDKGESVLETELAAERESEWIDQGDVQICSRCRGSRLNAVARQVRVQGFTIDNFVALSAADALKRIAKLKFRGNAKKIASELLPEIEQRLRFMGDVGLGYLSLARSAKTLSGGESQRIRLAAQLGSNLRGVLYVLDEPTIGLHPRDNLRLLETLTALRKKGNSLVIVEHDEETMRRADHIIDLGPRAGVHGGEVVASGMLRDIEHAKNSETGRCLRSPLCHPIRKTRRALAEVEGWIDIRNANANNLKNVNVRFPVGRLSVITGISGSGKSTLMGDVLLPRVKQALGSARNATPARSSHAARAGSPRTSPDQMLFGEGGGKGTRVACARRKSDSRAVSVSGAEAIDAVYEVDQSPIGKTSRSTPATYIKVFDEIRNLYAQLPVSRMRGYSASRFSFNAEGGRCESCGGQGVIKLEMNFLPSSYVPCEDCGGKRYNAQTLEVLYDGKSIGDVMEMTIEEAAEFFAAHPKIARSLKLLVETGLGYLKLGQPSPTLSGGEAQRLKLATELTRGIGRSTNERIRKMRKPKSTLYLLEEPTIGLHMADVELLLNVLHRLVDEGNTVIVIEHNVSVMAEADYIVDMGPEAGDGGGEIIATGTPEQVATNRVSRTAPFLRQVLRSDSRERRAARPRVATFARNGE